jgi:transcription initiation factor IIF auxiliary subunit
MNTLKSVFNRIAEEETKLSTHEIELGILQDIEKELITANAGAIKAIDLANAAKNPAAISLKLNKELLVKFQNFVKQIKDLGIENPQTEVQNGIAQVKENIKAIEKLISNLNSI